MGLLIVIAAIVVACASAAQPTGPPAEASNTTPLLFLGNQNIAPVVFLDGATPSGVAVDIVRALAQHMPEPVEIRVMDWPEAQVLVARGDADALIQINPTEERKKIYDFSDPLLESQFSIFTRSDKMGISGLSSLHGLRVGVESGGLPQQVLEKDPQILLTIIPNFPQGFKQLNEGSLDAVVVDYRVGTYVLAENNIQNIKVTGEPVAFSYSSFAVKKGNIKLLNEINHALQIIKADGTYQKILDNWKPTEVVFQTQDQITERNYHIAILILLLLFLIAGIWTVTIKKELAKRKAAEEKLREQYSTLRGIIDGADALIFSVDRHYRYTSFNRGHADVMKAIYGAEIEPGHSILEYMTVTEDRETARRNLDLALAGEPVVEEVYSGEELKARRYFQVSHSPIRTEEEIIGVAMLAQDITERKRAETALARVNRALRMLSDSNQTLVHITDETTLMNEICRIAVEVGGYRMAWIGFAEQDEAKTVRPVAHAGVDSGYIETARVSWADSERGRGPGGTAIRTGQPSMARNISVDPACPPWRAEAMVRGYQSIIALPLSSEGRTFGALGIYAKETDAFDTEEVKILTELADDLAFGITSLRTRARREQAEEALRQVNKKLNLLSSITRHDINNQLIAIKAFLELSKETLDDPAKMSENIIKVERAATAIESQIVFTKEYQDLGVKTPHWQPVDTCVKKAQESLPMRDVTVTAEVNNIEVYADPLFEKVFYNLIDNALRYGGQKMTMIHISLQEAGQGLIISVEDDGVGISEEEKKRLFESGFGHHTGLGLFLSHEILSITGITISETGTSGKGARFEIVVPKGGYRFTTRK